jgi:sugar-specific transcriptional regulator TrmB
MESSELIEAMARFGLPEREARLYLLLLRRGRATARELTRDSKIDRVLAYRTLDGMRSRGLVQVTADRPRRYVALSPTVLLERSLAERKHALEEDVALARTLEQQLPQITQSILEGGPRFQLITGTATTYPFLREMVQRAQKEIAVMLTYNAFRESRAAGMYEPLTAFVRGGGRFRLLVEDDPRLNANLQSFAAALRRYPQIEVRTIRPQLGRLTVVDERESLVFVVPETTRQAIEEVALWTDTPDFARAQLAHFDSLWAKARSYAPKGRSGPRRAS